jgi:hypothetical protein
MKMIPMSNTISLLIRLKFIPVTQVAFHSD